MPELTVDVRNLDLFRRAVELLREAEVELPAYTDVRNEIEVYLAELDAMPGPEDES